MAQTTITITYPDGMGSRLLDAFALAENYDTKKLPGETKLQFFDRMVKHYIRSACRRGEAQVAAETAYSNALLDIDAEVPIT